MESKDLIIVVLAVIVVILAIIAVCSLLGGNENLDDTNVTNDTGNDSGVVTININTNSNQPNQQVKNVTPQKNQTEPYVVRKEWSDQQDGYIYYYSDGSVRNANGQRIDNIN